MIGIIGAMEIEIAGIRSVMTDTSEKNVSGIRFVCGRLGNNDVVTAVCGVGKVFAAMCAEAMILSFNPEIIINTGIGGSLNADLKIGDIVVADKVVQHDMDTSPLGDPKGLISGINKIYFESDERVSKMLYESVEAEETRVRYGTVASGDQFIASKEQKKEISDIFSADVCEMEGASVAQVCFVNRVPFAVLRAVSDSADENASVDFPEFCKKTAKYYVNAVKRFAELY